MTNPSHELDIQWTREDLISSISLSFHFKNLKFNAAVFNGIHNVFCVINMLVRYLKKIKCMYTIKFNHINLRLENGFASYLFLLLNLKIN